MSDAGWPLQQAIYSVLSGALSQSVYDHVPHDSSFPYVVIGETTAVDDSNKTKDGQEHTVTIHVWSQYRGRKEVKEIMGLIYSALHKQDFAITGHHLVLSKFDFQSSIDIDADGKTYHGVVRYRIVTQPSS